MKKNQKGFSVISSLFTCAIIGMLAAGLSVNLNKTKQKIRQSLIKTDTKTIQVALEQYYADNGRYPQGKNTNMVESLKNEYIIFPKKTT
jgi:type II secretory pathway pseudopilin PulG